MIDEQYEPVFAGMLADAMSGTVPGLRPLTPERLSALRILKGPIEDRQTQQIPIVGKTSNPTAMRMRAIAAATTDNRPAARHFEMTLPGQKLNPNDLIEALAVSNIPQEDEESDA